VAHKTMKITRRTMLMSAGSVLGTSFLRARDAQEKGVPQSSRNRTETLSELVCLADFEAAARERMSVTAYEYIASGAADEITIRWNREAFDNLKLRPRVLVDVEKIDTSVEFFGQRLDFPILLAPTALHRLVHPEGEVETARGAGAAKATFVVSSFSTRRFEDIARATSEPLWFQLYDLSKDRHGFVRDSVQELEGLGCRALCVTVDAPVAGARNRQERARFRFPDDFDTPYYRKETKFRAGLPVVGSFTWDDIAWLRSNTDLPLLLKGILNPEDADLAVRAGISGVIVSNHGGRCLDTVPATISVLPLVVERVSGRVPVLMDGGVRRGTDVLKAVALGAKAVLIGRPYLYGLAAGGAAGVSKVVEVLRKEFTMAMALTGRRSLAEIDRSVVW
jgi:4-hydroxymandelate oxidase